MYTLGKVIIAGAGPGDPSLITIGAVEALKEADVVLYDRLVNPELLAYAPQAEHIYVGKRSKHTPFNEQNRIGRLMIAHARRGKTVVRLKGGDPFIFGRGSEECLELREAGIEFELISGVSSCSGVPGSLGIPLTHRGKAANFAVFTGHAAGGTLFGIDWELAARVDTAVFLMGVRHLREIITNLIAFGRNPETPVAIIERGTMPEEKVYQGRLDNIVEKAAKAKPPAIIVVGEVVGVGEAIGKLGNYDEAQLQSPFSRTRPEGQKPITRRYVVNA